MLKSGILEAFLHINTFILLVDITGIACVNENSPSAQRTT